MRVAYDISVLGLGSYNKCARTGVFRVVEKMAYGLLAATDIELVFYSSQGDQNTLMCQKYLEENTAFGNVQFSAGIPDLVDILHSPYYAIQGNGSEVAKFLTVYDLIPIISPKYFAAYDSAFLKDALTRIKYDGWVICISHSTKNDLCNYINIDPKRVFVSHLAADPLLFYPCKNLDRQKAVREKYRIPDQPYLLSVSTLEPRKNIDHVIRCFIKVIREGNIKDLNLVLVGTKGWNYDKIFKEIELSNYYKNRIILTEYVADNDLAPLYSGALAFAYLSHYEGFGLPPLEAMQCGVPVITSNTSSLPEVVGDAGILMAPNDQETLCQEILNFYQSPALQSKYASRSIEQAKKFSWDRSVTDMLTAYRIAVDSVKQGLNNSLKPLPPDFKLVIDGIYFQLTEKKDPIRDFWDELLKSFVDNGFAQNLIVLDRGGSSPWHPGINYQLFPGFDHKNIESDCSFIQHFCDYVGADLFVSTFYTAPTRTPSIGVIYDFLPNFLDRDLYQNLLSLSSRLSIEPSGYLAFSATTPITSSNPDKQIFNLNYNLFSTERETISPEVSSQFKLSMVEFTLPIISKSYNYLVFPEWKHSTEDLYLELKELFRLLALHPQRQDISLYLVVESSYTETVNDLLGGVVMELLMHENLEIFADEEVCFIAPLKRLQWQLFLPKFNGWIKMQNSSLHKIPENLMHNLPGTSLDQWY
jgi:glycosyltransferase involved in cell wall biosynthesis